MEAHVNVTDAGEEITLTLSRNDLLLLASSVNEALEAIDDWEFQTRLGADKSQALQIRNDLRDAIAQLPPAR